MLLKKIRTKGFLGHLASEDNDFVELDFTGKNLWLIHGENGAGKSSLFDAITMAFYKQHRGGASNFTNLIHDKADRAEIFIEFELHGKDYQVAVDIPRKSTVARRLQFWNGTNWETKNDTVEEWMAQNLKISYKTFVSSVVLRQGEADKFILEKATSRREIFLELLQLEFYKKLTERAKLRQKCVGESVQEIKRSLEGLENPTATDIKNQEKLVKQLGKELEKFESEKNAKQKELEDSTRARNLKNDIELIQAQQKRDAEFFDKATLVRGKHQYYVELERVLFGFDKVWREKDEIEKVAAALHLNQQKILKLTDDLKENAEQLGKNQIAYDASRTKLAELEKDLKKAKFEREGFTQKVDDIGRVVKLENRIELAAVAFNVAQVSVNQTNAGVADLKTKFDSKSAESDNLENQKRECENDLGIWSERLENRRKVVDKDECPVCGNELTGDEIHQKLVADFEEAETKVNELGEQKKNIEVKLAQIIVQVSALAKELETERENLQSALQKQSSANSKIETLQAQIDELPQFDGSQRANIADNLTNVQKTVLSLETQVEVAEENFERIGKFKRDAENLEIQLDSDLRSSNEQREILLKRRQEAEDNLSTANSQILPEWSNHAALRNKEELEDLRRERLNLQGIETEHRNLLEAEKREADLKGQIKALENQLRQILEINQREVVEVEIEFGEIVEKLRHQKLQFGEVESSCRKMQADKDKYVEKSGELKSIQKDWETWKTLAKTLGKEGLETKIVREAQCKINENANKTLKALSNDKFQLELEDSGKEMKIFVRDFTTGEQRQVEYCSGGEKFLTAVSLAVAVGQSASGQNIANTLIIDEGFGALDDKNRVLMVSELSRLTEVFQNGRVIIVSHQDDVQENFADRYRLSKNDDGLTCVKMGANL
jgi:exonuclease SbcC